MTIGTFTTKLAQNEQAGIKTTWKHIVGGVAVAAALTAGAIALNTAPAQAAGRCLVNGTEMPCTVDASAAPRVMVYFPNSTPMMFDTDEGVVTHGGQTQTVGTHRTEGMYLFRFQSGMDLNVFTF